MPEPREKGKNTAMEHKANILVIDDEAIVCRNCKRMLADEGYEVETTMNGFEALEHLKREDFDIAVVDLKMPEIGGMELLDASAGKLPPPSTHAPDLIIVDASTPTAGVGKLLQEVKDRLPAARCVALVSSLQQSAATLAAGADRVLLAGFSAAEFFQIIHELAMEGCQGISENYHGPI